jgi:hypothetical protein
MWWVGFAMTAALALGYWFGYREGGRRLRTAQRERDDLAQVLDDLNVPERQRSPRAPRRNDGRSEVTTARWSSHKNWR